MRGILISTLNAIVPRKRRRSYRAVTLLELLLTISASAFIMIGAAWQLNKYMAELKGKAAADQLTMISEAAESYIKNNALTVAGNVPNAGDKYNLPLATLVTAGYLPVGTINNSPYGSQYQIWVRGTNNSGFQALVATVGGDDPGRTLLPEIALQTKRNTGFVVHAPYTNADDNKILGTFGGWSANVSDFKPATGVAGQVWLASLLSVASDISGNDFLYRGAVPGRPDLNQMRTDITMTLNSGIVWKDPTTGQTMDVRLDKSDTTDETKLVVGGSTPTTDMYFANPNGKSPIQIQVKDDATPNPAAGGADNQAAVNDGGSTITINSTLDNNTKTAALDGYGSNDPYNLFVDGKANITGDLRVGGDLTVKGDTNLGDDPTDVTNVGGILNVTGPTTINNTLTVTDNAFFNKNVTIDGNLSISKCLAIGGATDDAGYCLNVGTGGRGAAAKFNDDVRIQGALNTTGDVTAENANMRAQAYFYQSDRRYKDNIESIDNPLDKLMKIQGVSYDWKNTGRKDMGVIAQNVEQVFPELVHTDANGYKSVEYGNLVAPIIESIRTLKDQNDQVKQENADLKKRLNQLTGEPANESAPEQPADQ